MSDRKTWLHRLRRRRWRLFPIDGLVLVFLALGWSLIFASASLGLQRRSQQWLPVRLVSRVNADYSVDFVESRLAPVRSEIVDAVKEDSLIVESATAPVMIAQVTPTTRRVPMFGAAPLPTPTITPTLPLSALGISAGGPYSGTEGSPVALVARVAATTTMTINFQWDLDNDGLYDDRTGALAEVTFFDEGTYTIGLRAIDQAGQVAEATTYVTVLNVPPTIVTSGARFGGEGESISFSATVSDPGQDVLLYTWDFGDGTGATGTLAPRHVYLDDGEYEVRLRAEDNDGGVADALIVAYVNNLPPVVDAGLDKETFEGGSLAFSGTATDPGVLDDLTFAWDWDYDGRNFTPDAFGRNASTVYGNGPASFVAALRVQDKDGGQAIDTVNVAVGNVAPAILGVTNDGPVGEGSPLTISINASDAGNDPLAYAFDWDNDGTFDAVDQPASVSRIWYNQGDYTVGIRADDGDGGQAFTTTVVSAFNIAPTAVVAPVAVQLEGSLVNFNGSGSTDPGIFDPLTYQWDFGDGSPVANGITVTHAYADNNIYTAVLTVTDESGASNASSVGVTILNADPRANAGPDLVLDEGKELGFSGSGSDPGAADALSYAWDLDNDGKYETPGQSAVFSAVKLDGPSNYVVSLRVRDDDYPYPTDGGGQVGEAFDTLQVTVNNVAPVVDAGGPYQGHPGQAITMTGTALDVPADVLTYEWDFDQDGKFDLTGRTVVTSWNVAAVYTITLRVTDDDGGRGTDTARVNVGNRRPTASAGGPYTGREGRAIELTGSGSDPDNDPLTYFWDLDYDNNFETPGQVITYTWPDNGIYTVTLKVDDGWGGSATDVTVVTVRNAPPRANAGGPYTATVGVPLTLSGSGTDVASDTLTYAWDLDDDGNFESPGQVVTYVWATTGTYTVTLQVEDDDGGVGQDSTSVNVNAVVPIAWIWLSYMLLRGKRVPSLRRRRPGFESYPEHRLDGSI